MRLIKRIVLLKARLDIGLNKETLDDFESAMSAIANRLFVALAKAKKQSKDYGFTVAEEQKLREQLDFINQSAFPDNPLNISEVEEQVYQQLCQDNVSSAIPRPK